MENTVGTISERVLRIINQGAIPRDSKFNLRDVGYMVRDILGKQIVASWYEGRNTKEAMDVNDAFITVINRPLQQINTEVYVDIDFDFITLPDGSGIQSVRQGGQGNPLNKSLANRSAFIPVPARFDDIYRSLPAQSLEGMFGWALRGNRMWFTQVNGQNLIEMGVTDVDIDAISMSELNADTPLPISPNVSAAIIEQTVAFFAPTMQGVKDILNDNNPNLR